MTTVTLPRATVEQALEALETLVPTKGPSIYNSARDALRAALAQQAEPVQKPVAWLYEAGTDRTLHWYKPPLHGTPLYTSPPQRKPLSEEEIIDATEHIDTSRNGYFIHIARAIERALGIPMPGDPK